MPIRTQSVESVRRRGSVEIGNPGIKKALNRFTPYQALAEFVWNGFDSGATTVDILYDRSELGHVQRLTVMDDGSGIVLADLERKFTPFLHSNKQVDPSLAHDGPGSIHGKNGQGRLTFFKFATAAEWTTTYRDSEGQCWSYNINIASERLRDYDVTARMTSVRNPGTSVTFVNVVELFDSGEDVVEEYLIREFAWFLELYAPTQKTIRINGKSINWKAYIADEVDFEREIQGIIFSIRYRRWIGKLNREYSRFYFVDSTNKEKSRKTTSLNNKGDEYYHSIYVKSEYFDAFEMVTVDGETDQESDQTSLAFSELRQDDVIRELLTDLNAYLRTKRRPFLRQQAVKWVSTLEQEKALPTFSSDPWDQMKKAELQEIMREVYEVEPRIFNGLTKTQTQTMVQLFSLAMNSSERDSLLGILEEVVNLDAKERDNLAAILKSAQLSNVIATIKLISDRFTAMDELRSMVFDRDFGANERDHLQTHIERHFWIFGEQYHLVTAAEQKFEEALRRYTHLLTGEEVSREIDHPDKNREMDVFAVRTLNGGQEVNNIVVELKHRDVTLGEKQLSQVKKYMSVILEQDEFNGNNVSWEFFLVGNKVDKHILSEIQSHRNHGIKNLVHIGYEPNYRIYVLKWSEVLANFELRHNFILQKLKVEREKLSSPHADADEILAHGHSNSAAMHWSN